MATGRTLDRWARIYQNGYDLSGETRSIGALAWDADFTAEAGLNWDIKGGMIGQDTIQTGQVNTILRFDTTAASSPHDWIKGMDQSFVRLMVAIGIRAEPAMGDPVWMAVQEQKTSTIVPGDGGMVTTTIDYERAFSDGQATEGLLNYPQPWGVLLHAKAAETGASTATGYDGGASTAKGGWMMAQLFACAGTGTATIKVQDAAVNSNASFADVTGLTTGAISNSAIPCGMIAQAATNATIRQYVRFQVALSGITSCTFALAFARGR